MVVLLVTFVIYKHMGDETEQRRIINRTRRALPFEVGNYTIPFVMSLDRFRSLGDSVLR